jgi:Ca2+-binding EF-hand superfamily protein
MQWFAAGGAGGAGGVEFSARARKVFDSYDSRGCGRLDRQETKLAWVALLGCKPSRCELADLLGGGKSAETTAGEEDARKGDDALVGWAQFSQAALRRRIGTDCSDEVRQAFRAFDRRCAGFLTLGDVKTVRLVAGHCNGRVGVSQRTDASAVRN